MFASRRATLTMLAFAAALSAGACADFGRRSCESTECVEDARLQAEVSRQINARSSLRFFNIRIQASHRDVYLEGLVDTDVDRGMAAEIARSVDGVRNVYNGLELYGNGY